MRYFAGIDGGGTKTHCMICDENGIIVGEGKAGASNYQIVGSESCGNEIGKAFSTALNGASLNSSKITYVFLGLSGADEPYDIKELNYICSKIFNTIAFEVVNDVWICFRSALRQKWGAVSICGTGFNAAAKNIEGKEIILRAEGFELGNLGGGDHLSRIALHHAFRADEGTGSDTLLQTEIPKALDFSDMDSLFSAFRKSEELLERCLDKIPPLVFKLAAQRDRVSQNILINFGNTMGQEICGVISRCGMEDRKFPVVLGGSIYNDHSCPLLIDSLITRIHQTAQNAYIIFPQRPPVAGALICALEAAGIASNDTIYNNIGI
ncbi:MAG: ATPase [Eubacterium sp.]|jgi:N-acetylglucosamine kinase-like BadF-type ATPase|nr:ATPase [Eubacterium sp.]